MLLLIPIVVVGYMILTGSIHGWGILIVAPGVAWCVTKLAFRRDELDD